MAKKKQRYQTGGGVFPTNEMRYADILRRRKYKGEEQELVDYPNTPNTLSKYDELINMWGFNIPPVDTIPYEELFGVGADSYFNQQANPDGGYETPRNMFTLNDDFGLLHWTPTKENKARIEKMYGEHKPDFYKYPIRKDENFGYIPEMYRGADMYLPAEITPRYTRKKTTAYDYYTDRVPITKLAGTPANLISNTEIQPKGLPPEANIILNQGRPRYNTSERPRFDSRGHRMGTEKIWYNQRGSQIRKEITPWERPKNNKQQSEKGTKMNLDLSNQKIRDYFGIQESTDGTEWWANSPTPQYFLGGLVSGYGSLFETLGQDKENLGEILKKGLESVEGGLESAKEGGNAFDTISNLAMGVPGVGPAIGGAMKLGKLAFQTLKKGQSNPPPAYRAALQYESNPYGYEHGGMVDDVFINVEKDELRVRNGEIITDYSGLSRHAKNIKNEPRENFVRATPGDIIIPRKSREAYLSAPVSERKGFERQFANQDRPQYQYENGGFVQYKGGNKVKKYSDGGYISNPNHPLYKLPKTTVGTQFSTSDITVQDMQNFLLDAGYELPKDGADNKYGPETELALETYNKDNPLAPISYAKGDIRIPGYLGSSPTTRGYTGDLGYYPEEIAPITEELAIPKGYTTMFNNLVRKSNTYSPEERSLMTLGNKIGAASSIFGPIAQGVTTLANRAMTPDPVNYMRTTRPYDPALRSFQGAISELGRGREAAIDDINLGLQGVYSDIDNAISSTPRNLASKLAARGQANRAIRRTAMDYAQRVAGGLQAKGQVEAQKGRDIALGEERREDKQVRDIDNFSTQFSNVLAQLTLTGQQTGKMLNQYELSKIAMNILQGTHPDFAFDWNTQKIIHKRTENYT